MLKKLTSLLLTIIIIICAMPLSAFAEDDNVIVYRREIIGRIRSDGSILFVPQADDHKNSNALYYLLEDDINRTIVLPKTTLKLDRTLMLGNNKTIIAKGATIIQKDFKPLVINNSKKLNYNSVKNVTIDGGTWRIAPKGSDSKKSSTIRFCHARDIE